LESLMEYPSSQIAGRFKEFWTRHEANNRHLWSSRIAAQFVRAYIEGHKIDPSTTIKTFLRENLKAQLHRNINIRHYKGPYVEGVKKRVEVSVAHFLDDLEGISSDLMYESVVVNEIRALELLLKAVFETVAPYVLESDSVQPNTKRMISQRLTKVSGNERARVGLNELSSLLPNLGVVLDSSTYKREENPLLSTKINEISCMDSVSMWREVRNLIIHHDGKVNKRFRDRWSHIYLAILGDRIPTSKVLPVGAPLLIRLRNVLYCMTTCYQTCVVLYVALGGSRILGTAAY